MSEAVTHSTAHYLKAIHKLLKERGYARAVDVAEEMDISRTAAHLGLKSLKTKGMVREDERHFFTLPEEYENLAVRLEGNLTVLEAFFSSILELNPQEAHRTACQIEHQLSPEASHRFLALTKFVLTHPSGKKLLKAFRKARELCPVDGNCILCNAYETCPLGTDDWEGRK